MKVSKNILVFTFYMCTMLLPGYYTNSVINMLENILFLLMVLILFQYRFKPSKICVSILAYILLLCISSFVNHSSIANIHMIISNAKVIVMLFSVEWIVNNYGLKAIKPVWIFVFIILFINTITIILNPTGLYQVEYVWNEWGAKDLISTWATGNKNSQATWYLLLLVLTYGVYNFRGYRNKRFFGYFFCVICCGLSVFTLVFVKSSTGIVSILLLVVGMFLTFQKKIDHKINWNPQLFFAFYAVISVLIIKGTAIFLQPLIFGIFHKDLTFSNRIIVWERAILLFLEKPIIGWGYMGTADAQNLFGSLAFTSAHNQFLNSAVQGGIILIGILIIIFIILFSKVSKCRENVKIFATIATCSLLIVLTFEAVLLETQCWLCLYMIYIISDYSSKNNKMG